ncbi:DUF2500 domain-containing protein [Sporolactobacillus sp. CPB3-1]|uniref:DUF2500 domain-containing protein n=1 Tax=Sporolactobacillus mangiferae TaxID=2940498 RepID=A0ABT0MBM7_9BACL|nr:DUF2500 domain-containing protein [Sporolactobacillus mangiferae]MCL1631684.1 DUF2500 domain-containing protein [Sporolactobacillus mangiferae]
MFDDSFGATFQLTQIFIFVCFALVTIGVAFNWIKKMTALSSNQPRMSVPAKIVGKRAGMSGGNETFVSTNYYATFEVASEGRIEFHINENDYGQMAEGDHGMRTFQGTPFGNFERDFE